MAVADPDNFPVPFAGSAIDENLLTHLQWIGFKYDDICFFHKILPSLKALIPFFHFLLEMSNRF
jgi:hypothetical protein